MLNNKVKILLVSFVHHIELQYFLIAPPRRIRWHTSTLATLSLRLPANCVRSNVTSPSSITSICCEFVVLLVGLLACWLVQMRAPFQADVHRLPRTHRKCLQQLRRPQQDHHQLRRYLPDVSRRRRPSLCLHWCSRVLVLV